MGVKQEFHPQAERWHWVAQRTGWALMALLLLAAVFGLSGNGLLTDTTTTASSDGIELTVDYSRFARMRSAEKIALTVAAPGASGTLSVTVSSDFSDAIAIHGITPPPDSTSISPGGPTYEWNVEDWSQEARVSFNYEPDEWRKLDGRFDVQAGELFQAVSFWQFVFP